MRSELPRSDASRPTTLVALLIVSFWIQACAGASAGAPLELSNRDELPATWLDTIPDRLGRCVPARLSRGDTLTLRMSQPHPDQLAAVNPRDEWLYLVHDHRPSVLSPDVFARRDSVRMVASRVRAYVSVVDRDTLEHVFVEPGTYRFVLADQLGTDITQPVYRCFIRYGER